MVTVMRSRRRLLLNLKVPEDREKARAEVYKVLCAFYRRTPDEIARTTPVQQLAMLSAMPHFSSDLTFDSMEAFNAWKRSKNG